MAQTLMIKELDVHIGENTVWVSHDKAGFQKIREHSHMIWLGNTAIIMYLLIDLVVIHFRD